MSTPMPAPASAENKFDPTAIRRPDPALMHYYIIIALCTVFGFPIVLLERYIRYRTLEYKIDDKGVSMKVGILFRREVYLTYRRIQDIHVTKNIIHRWLGLSAVAIQTASGSSSAEMTIEGIRNPEALRDFLYSKMRGARDEHDQPLVDGSTLNPNDEALVLLREIRDELAARRHGATGGRTP